MAPDLNFHLFQPSQLQDSSGGKTPSIKPKHKMPCGKGKGPCPTDVETRLQEYSETTQQLVSAYDTYFLNSLFLPRFCNNVFSLS